MASNTLDIVHPTDFDDSDYQYEVQNLAQVMHFIDNNNVQSSDNEPMNNYSSGNKSVDSENGQMVMEIAYKYQFQIMSEIQNIKQILKWDGMDIAFRPMAKCWNFPRRGNAAHGSRKE